MEPDWKQHRPSEKDIKCFWKNEAVFRPSEKAGEGINQVISAFSTSHSNGGAKFGAFSFSNHPVLNWFVSRNRFTEINFFEHLFASNVFQANFPDVDQLKDPENKLEWKWSNALVFAGDIANSLTFGGAYKTFPGSGRVAKDLGEMFAKDLFGDRYEDIQIFLTYSAWSTWFHEIAWDKTWVGVDLRESIVWTLFVTDTD